MKKKIAYLIVSLLITAIFPAHAQPPFIIHQEGTYAGFFATFSSALAALSMYDQKQYAGLKIDWNRGVYLDPERGPNWWDYYFEPIHLGDSHATHHILTNEEISQLAGMGFNLSREQSFKLIQTYIHLKPEIKKEVSHFTQDFFKDYYVIGVHHRGTDKKIEVPIVPYAKTLQILDLLITNFPDTLKDKIRIYVATDEENFLKYIVNIYPSLVIYSNFVRSQDGNPLHYNNSCYPNNYQKGKEALIDCLLLSKCQCLLYPACSSLSICALKFNPDLPAIAL